MSDYTGKNIFEKIATFIPGYEGYSQRKGRRDTDRILRQNLAERLLTHKEHLDSLIRDLSGQGRLDLLCHVETVRKRLDLLANQIKFVSGGESGFFDVAQVGAADLDRLYRYDSALLDDVQKVMHEIAELGPAETIERGCTHLEQTLLRIGDKLDERDRLILEER